MDNKKVLHLVKANQKSLSYEELLELLAKKEMLLAEKKARITELEKELEIAKKTSQNANTEMYNNHCYFLEQAEIMANHSLRNGNSMIIAIADIDNLKGINDSLGHLIGDKILQNVSISIKSTLRRYDLPFNCGGDEFQILVTYESDGKNNAEEFAAILSERIQVGVSENPLILSGIKIPISISIGAIVVDFTKTITEEINRADRKMYRQKQLKKAGRI